MNVCVESIEGKLAVPIPEDIAVSLRLSGGSLLDISECEGSVVMRPVASKKPTLDELLAQVTDENLHEEIDFGPPVGKEVW